MLAGLLVVMGVGLWVLWLMVRIEIELRRHRRARKRRGGYVQIPPAPFADRPAGEEPYGW